MATAAQGDRRHALTAELIAAQGTLHRLMDTMSDDDWRRQSKNPGWTNGEILFHMAFGFFLLPSLVPMARLLGRLPRGSTRPFAAVLNLSVTPFNWVNAMGPRIGGRFVRRDALRRTYDRVMRRTLRIVSRIRDDEWQRGMYYPTRWDALFHECMTVERILRYPIAHMRFHLDQLSLTARPPS